MAILRAQASGRRFEDAGHHRAPARPADVDDGSCRSKAPTTTSPHATSAPSCRLGQRRWWIYNGRRLRVDHAGSIAAYDSDRPFAQSEPSPSPPTCRMRCCGPWMPGLGDPERRCPRRHGLGSSVATRPTADWRPPRPPTTTSCCSDPPRPAISRRRAPACPVRSIGTALLTDPYEHPGTGRLRPSGGSPRASRGRRTVPRPPKAAHPATPA